jgi:hypothetical protein
MLLTKLSGVPNTVHHLECILDFIMNFTSPNALLKSIFQDHVPALLKMLWISDLKPSALVVLSGRRRRVEDWKVVACRK